MEDRDTGRIHCIVGSGGEDDPECGLAKEVLGIRRYKCCPLDVGWSLVLLQGSLAAQEMELGSENQDFLQLISPEVIFETPINTPRRSEN